MLRPLIVIRRTPKIDFMRWHKLGFALSGLLLLGSIGLFSTVGLNYGIDFVGGTMMQVRVTSGPANLADMRHKLDALRLGGASLQGFGPPTDVLIRLPRQPGGDAAQEKAVAAARQADVEGLRIGVVSELRGDGYQAGVLARFGEAVELLESLGAKVSEVSCPHFGYGLPAYYLIAPSECSSNLARFDAMRYGLRVGDDGTRDAEEVMALTREQGFGAEVKRRVILGTYALSSGYYDAYYGKAQQVRTLIIRDFDAAFSQVDALTAEALRAEVLDIWAEKTQRMSSILMVSHDIKEVAYMADRIVVLSANPGRVRTVVESRDKRVSVDVSTARHVDQPAIPPHRGELGCSDDALGLGRQGEGEEYHLRLRERVHEAFSGHGPRRARDWRCLTQI